MNRSESSDILHSWYLWKICLDLNPSNSFLILGKANADHFALHSASDSSELVENHCVSRILLPSVSLSSDSSTYLSFFLIFSAFLIGQMKRRPRIRRKYLYRLFHLP